MSLVYCIVQFDVHVHDSVAISSVDTGPKRVTRVHHFMLHAYYSITKQRFSTTNRRSQPTSPPTRPNHWLLVASDLLFDKLTFQRAFSYSA